VKTLAVVIALGVTAMSACATDRRKPEVVRPRSARITPLPQSDFRPIRQMEENGRNTPAVARRCTPGMQVRFDPSSSIYVATIWGATSEFVSFVVEVVPRLLDLAEQQPEQSKRKNRFMTANELVVNGAELGGIIELKRRRSRPRGLLVRETLFTDDLWMRNPATGNVVYFDGRVDYGAADLRDFTDAMARVSGWFEVHRVEPDQGRDLLGADVVILLEALKGERVAVEGSIDTACGGKLVISAVLRYGRCQAGPASVIESVRLRRGPRTLDLRADELDCDECVLRAADGEPWERFCPSTWSSDDGEVTPARPNR